MAGLWVLTVIAGSSFVCLIAASVLSLVLYLAAKRRTRERGLKDRRLTLISGFAPFLGLLWLAFALLLHVQISNHLAHQDCGLSGDPYVTLPNGYEVGSLNTYDGYLLAPGFKTDTPIVGPGYVRSIVSLHYADPYFTGTLFDFNTSTIRSFVFDTKTRAVQLSNPSEQNVHRMDPFHPTTADMDAWTVANDEAQTGADSYWKTYERYRHHWPNYILVAMVLLGEGTILQWLRFAWRSLPAETEELRDG